MLATDYTAPAGSGYRIEGGVVRSEDGTIAGSALHCDQAVRNLMSFARIPFEAAIVAATRAPARLLGLEREYGSLLPEKRADMSLWDSNDEVFATILDGRLVYGAEHFRGVSPNGAISKTASASSPR